MTTTLDTPIIAPVPVDLVEIHRGDLLHIPAGVAGKRELRLRVTLVDEVDEEAGRGFRVTGSQQLAAGGDGRIRPDILLRAGTYTVEACYRDDEEIAMPLIIGGRRVDEYTVDARCPYLHNDSTVVGYAVRQTIGYRQVLWRGDDRQPGRIVAAFSAGQYAAAFSVVDGLRHRDGDGVTSWALVDMLYACGHRGDH